MRWLPKGLSALWRTRRMAIIFRRVLMSRAHLLFLPAGADRHRRTQTGTDGHGRARTGTDGRGRTAVGGAGMDGHEL